MFYSCLFDIILLPLLYSLTYVLLYMKFGEVNSITFSQFVMTYVFKTLFILRLNYFWFSRRDTLASKHNFAAIQVTHIKFVGTGERYHETDGFVAENNF